MAKILETRELVTNFYTYEGVVKALNKVSLVMEHGSTFGLVGESGCGKSVTVRSVMRIVQSPGKVESGKIIIFLDTDRQDEGVELLEQSEAYMQSLRGDKISMIFQEPNAALNPIMSIGDQLAESYLFHRKAEICRHLLDNNGKLGPLKPLYELAARKPNSFRLKMHDRLPILKHWRRPMNQEIRRRSVKVLEQLGIAHPERILDSYPHNLSGGMKQRIVIGMALACNPSLLIADEATSNLDVTIQAQILELLKQLKKTFIASILLITHDMGVVAETCDKVAVMYAGNVAEVAAVEELFNNPIHPYAHALLDSVPKYTIEGKLKSIEGTVPNLVHPPRAAAFIPAAPMPRMCAPRCCPIWRISAAAIWWHAMCSASRPLASRLVEKRGLTCKSYWNYKILNGITP
jgi:peptide/nickel transport system ATP-binding protein